MSAEALKELAKMADSWLKEYIANNGIEANVCAYDLAMFILRHRNYPMSEIIGLGKPASKTADWIVDTYIQNAPVSYRLSIEHAIAKAIMEALEPVKRELLSQPAPRTYEVARALTQIEEFGR